MNVEQIKTELSKLIEDLAPFLDDSSLKNVKSFQLYNELKLALEFLCEYIYEDGISLEREFILRINKLCEVLDIDKIYWLE